MPLEKTWTDGSGFTWLLASKEMLFREEKDIKMRAYWKEVRVEDHSDLLAARVMDLVYSVATEEPVDNSENS